MSPVVAETTYRAVCDLCAVYRCSSGEDTPDAASDWAGECGWLIVGPLAICPQHMSASSLTYCAHCGRYDQAWLGTCADCWTKAMSLPRGACDQIKADWGTPSHDREVHACNQLRDSHGSHPGPHQCPCGAEWGAHD